MKRNKSPLQTTMEKDGWALVANQPINDMNELMNGGILRVDSAYEHLFGIGEFLPTELHLEREYGSQFKEVRLEQAYDCEGNPLPRNRIVAIYVRG